MSDTTGTQGGQNMVCTLGLALSPKDRKRQTIALLEKVADGAVSAKKAFELLKEIV